MTRMTLDQLLALKSLASAGFPLSELQLDLVARSVEKALLAGELGTRTREWEQVMTFFSGAMLQAAAETLVERSLAQHAQQN